MRIPLAPAQAYSPGRSAALAGPTLAARRASAIRRPAARMLVIIAMVPPCFAPLSIGAHGFARGRRARGGAAVGGCAPRLARQRAVGGGAARLMLEHVLDRACDARAPRRLALALPRFI